MTMDKFEYYYSVTKIDIKQFFQDALSFIESGYPRILSYYSGGDVPGSSFDELDRLLGVCGEIDSAFFLFSSQLETLDMWELLDQFDDTWGKLLTINNTSKWMRSSRVGRYDSKFYLERLLGDFDNFEKVSKTLGFDSPQDDWEQIAIDNFIREEDYSPRNGGPIFKVSLSSTASFGIQNIVDSLVDKRVLGKDIDKRFYFTDNDLAIVEYEDAVTQAIDTILNTKKGDIPEFPEDGVANETVGSNIAIIQYPSLFRNLSSMFYKDNRFIEINLLSLDRKADYVNMKIKIVTINKDSFITNINL